MSSSAQVARPSIVGPTVVAALIGGVLIDLFLIVVGREPVPGLWQFLASLVVGKVAFTSASYAVLGLVLHMTTSLTWAFLYVYVWRAINSLSNWIVGGLVWGVVVAVCMTIFLAFFHIPPSLGPMDIVSTLAGHCVFYGLPVAWYVSRSVRNA